MKKLILIITLFVSLLSCDGQVPGIGGMRPVINVEQSAGVQFWTLKTNSPSTTTFDPQLITLQASESVYTWDWGDGSATEEGMDMSHTYADATTKTVRVTWDPEEAEQFYKIDVQSDNIIDTLNLTWLANMSANGLQIYFNNNSQLTHVLFNESPTGLAYLLRGQSCNLQDTLDISMFENWSAYAQLQVWGNTNLDAILFPDTMAGAFNTFYLNSTGLNIVDLSTLKFGSSAYLQLNSCPNLQHIIPPITGTGATIKRFYSYGCDLQDTLDISWITSNSNNSILIHSNPDLTHVLTPISTTGTVKDFSAYSTGIKSLDLSGYIFEDAAAISVYGCDSLVSITLPATSTNNFSSMLLQDNPNLGPIDFSGQTNMFGANISLNLINNEYTAGELNQMLTELAALVESEPSGGNGETRSVSINGTNGIPDSTSGGYDGLAAIATLEDKLITVYYNE